MTHPIGVFDSGYGGLTVLKEITAKLPQYDFIYLGDNARAPYGSRSFETIYEYTLQAVKWLFDKGCPLVILACNTASAKALRTIQQNDLQKLNPENRVLGVIRPTTEVIGNITETKSVGILGTSGTINSNSYKIEIEKFYPNVNVYQEACPMWVPLIENGEYESKGADYFVKDKIENLLEQSGDIDTILLACTHYPLMIKKIEEYTPVTTKVISQGEIVANSLADYLHRHPEMESRLTKTGNKTFYTTDNTDDFNKHAELFYGGSVSSMKADIE